MSLGIHVFPLAELRRTDAEGEAAVRRDLERICRALVARGLAPHEEPARATCDWPRGLLASMSYATFEALQRHVAGGWKDLRGAESPRAIGAIELRSHLVSHSATGGYFVPQAFALPLYATGGEATLPGGLVGSAVQLLAELDALRASLGITSPAPGTGDDAIVEGWRTLHAAATISVEHGTAIWLQ